MSVSDILYRLVQRARERHSPPVVNKASVRWPTPSPSTPGLVVEDLEYYVEEGPQGWVPLRIIRPMDERDRQLQQQQQQRSQAPPEPAPDGGAVAAVEAAAEAEAGERAGPETPPDLAPAAEPAAEQQRPSEPVAVEPVAAGAEEAEESDAVPGPGAQAELPPAVRRPLIVFMHATGENMDVVRPKQELYARMGYFTAAIDARYHGQRAAVPWEVAAALNAAAPKLASPPQPSKAAAAVATGDAAAALVATVKGLNPDVLAALQRADAAAGLSPGSVASGGGAATAAEAAAETPPPLLSGRTMARVLTRTAAPAGSRTAAAEAREEAEALQRALAHERFVAAWLGVTAEFRERRSAEATTAILATAPPPPLPAAAAAASSPRPLTSPRDGAVAAAIAAAAAAAAQPAAATAAAGGSWAVTHGSRGAAAARADRVTARNVYELALAACWRDSGEQPLFLDTVWDLVLLLDALALREEVDMARVGVTGFSMGGTITWLLSIIDPRVTVAAPVSGVQGFGWAVDNESYHARVGRYPFVFEVAAADLKGTKTSEIDTEVVTAVWNKLLPGMLSFYDAHLSLPSLAPRPLLVATGELDKSCPLPGVEQAAESTRAKYLEWARDQRRQHLEEEAEAEMEAAAAAQAAVVAEAEAEASGAVGGGGQGSRVLGQEGSRGGASSVGGRSGTSTGRGSPVRSRSATDVGGGGGAAAVYEEEEEEEEEDPAAVVDPALAAAMEEAKAAAVAAAASTAEEAAAVAAAAAAAAAAAHAAAVAAARAAALAAAAEQQRREEEAIGALLGSRFRYVAEVGVGHTETDTMRRAVERWMQQHLLEPWMRERIAARAAAAAAATAADVAADVAATGE
ncbi:hypothetical protein PLESTB_000035800 [Pleodorina starrii]|uniref:Uncharacterized protein n=1 Tax=Pleodorina starrii TaxID=330485 RepID=A0A9W6EX44_9CHLO|nr:hypothetical protein PLESTB_000035800 [Pleodorina starrii]GLC70689.1 hypothetical protein PLESTF_001022700 [Pleodorina starrii]